MKFLRPEPISTNLAALLLRLIFGGMFIYHGWMKLDNYDQILPMFGDVIGIGSKLSFHLVIFAEFFCGILVTIGFLTRLTVLPILINMSVAFFIAHKADPFTNKQLPLIYLVLSLVVFFLGSGKISVDGLMFRKKR